MNAMSKFTLITGGARSGKSHFAELLAASAHCPVTYIATAQIRDQEMVKRVQKHQEQRPKSWQLIEEPLNIRDILIRLKDYDGIILLDCVTLWLSNLLLAGQTDLSDWAETDTLKIEEAQILTRIQNVAQLAQEIKPQVLFVTNEVGQGIVPENPLARVYRDLSGRCNQILAQRSDHVYLVVAGYPLEIKSTGQMLLTSLLKE